MSGSASSGGAAGPGAGPLGIEGPAGKSRGESCVGVGLIVDAFSGCVSMRASGCAVGATSGQIMGMNGGPHVGTWQWLGQDIRLWRRELRYLAFTHHW